MRLLPLLLLALLLPHAVPTIDVVASVDKTTVFVGEEIHLSFEVKNSFDDIKNVTLSRKTPSGFQLVSNESRVGFLEEMKKGETINVSITIKPIRAGVFLIEPLKVSYVYENNTYNAYSNRIEIHVYEKTQKAIEEAVNTSVKLAAIAGGLSAIVFSLVLVVRRPKKPRKV